MSAKSTPNSSMVGDGSAVRAGWQDGAGPQADARGDVARRAAHPLFLGVKDAVYQRVWLFTRK